MYDQLQPNQVPSQSFAYGIRPGFFGARFIAHASLPGNALLNAAQKYAESLKLSREIIHLCLLARSINAAPA
jgi:hypothetical protein